MDAIAPGHHSEALWGHITARVGQLIGERQAQPARVVVLLPYVQLVAVARAAWGRHAPDGFSPRFETTRSWADRTAFEPGELDFASDMGRDLPIARSLLVRAGFESRADALAPRVVDAAQQLAAVAAAVEPAQRAQWAASARVAAAQGMDAQPLQIEAAVSRLAVEWLAVSSFATDALLAPQALDDVDLLVILEGVRPDPLQEALARRAGPRAERLKLAVEGPRGQLALQAARDMADEAERAAACVLRHVAANRVPVALAATDRILTRRAAALLREAGVRIRDEQGWKLSTTRSAAQVMALLASAQWDAPTDQVLDWLKHVPAAAPGSVLALALERRARRAGLREWRSLRAGDCGESRALHELFEKANAWREALAGTRTLAEWILALSAVLQETGQLARLRGDEAGAQVLDHLRLGTGGAVDLSATPAASRRMGLADFRAWVDAVLEAGSFHPVPPPEAQVVILPFVQTLARPFAALVLPGCDELHLPASPEAAGAWTASQRRALGLAGREEEELAQRTAWSQALRIPQVDILWRASDGHGEPLLASPLVQSLMLEGAAVAADPRDARSIDRRPVARPEPVAQGLAVAQLSASAYEDLRRCPYRFFALRQLALKESEELDTDVDKRDFGNWVHAVLRGLHESLRDEGEPVDGRAALADRIASEALAAMRLEPGEFLPFEAGWPGVRDAYLEWLAKHEARGGRFLEAESDRRHPLAPGVELIGRIDRIDSIADARLLIDYKTESSEATKERMREPAEDTQLAFYAALVGGDDVQAAYLNIGERGRVLEVPHPRVLEARDLMRSAIAGELGRISAGANMPALGEGVACEFCAARGLCRKDWWA